MLKTPEEKRESKRAYREANKERIAAKKAADAKTPHGRELDRQRHRRYMERNRERVLAHGKEKRQPLLPALREAAREKRLRLGDSYVCQLLRLPTAGTPPEIIQKKRAQMIEKRMELQRRKAGAYTHKICPTCGTNKKLSMFGKNVQLIDGRNSVCRLCVAARRSLERDSCRTYTPRQRDVDGLVTRQTQETLTAHKRRYYAARCLADPDMHKRQYHAQKEQPNFKERKRAAGKKFRDQHPEKGEVYSQRRVEEMPAAYVAQLLRLPVAGTPPALMEAKRMQILIQRKLKELT